jgi:hypothetical protein
MISIGKVLITDIYIFKENKNEKNKEKKESFKI